MNPFTRLCDYLQNLSRDRRHVGRQSASHPSKGEVPHDEVVWLSTIRHNIEVSECVLYHAEQYCKMAESRFVYGEADEVELSDARASFAKAKAFFMQSLCELQSALAEFESGKAA